MRFLIWRFGGLEKIAKLNSANIKSRGTSQLATQVPGILYTAPALQERYRYTPQRMRCWGFLSLSLSGKEICIGNENMRSEQTAALHSPRRSHLEAK